MTRPPAPPGPAPHARRRRRPPLWIPVLIAVVLLPIAAVRLLASSNGTDVPNAAGGSNNASSPPANRTLDRTTATPIGPKVTATATEQGHADALPPCGVGDDVTPDGDADDWARTLLDTDLRLPEGYVPPDLVSVTQAGFPEQNLLIRGLVVDDLTDLRDAAEDSDDPIDIIAAYRSFADQRRLFQERVRQFGLAKAYAHAAVPGHSEHQLGTTIDFSPPDADDVDESFGDTAAGRWLAENAYRFGFVQSYPKAKSNVTCYGYEPWHFRYVGRERAERMHASGLTLREFLWQEAHSG